MIERAINQFQYRDQASYTDHELIIQNHYAGVPARAQEFISVPGRSGELLRDQGMYLNTRVSYDVVYIGDKPSEATRRLSGWLNGVQGYQRLSDTYEPEYYRLAAFNGPLDLGGKLQNLEPLTIEFICKPMKYSFSGLDLVTITTDTSLINAEILPSEPIITIYGSGNITLYINNRSYYIVGVEEFITINSEIYAAYKGSSLQNGKLRFTSFPVLQPGENTISWVGNVNKIEIIPRWCSI